MSDSPPCPFCVVSSTSPPAPDPTIAAGPSASSYVVLSTPEVISFLDVAPVARGHILLCPRTHMERLSDVPTEQSAVLGFWLPIVSRAVMRAVYGGKGSWNVVNANGKQGPGEEGCRLMQIGPEAGQTAPHVHFHIIPRPAPGAESSTGELNDTKKDASVVLDVQRRNVAVAEGLRRKLDDEDALDVCAKIREAIKHEIDYLKRKGDIVEGREEWELWGNVEGRKGVKL
jgi:diadenosine tetraphosphate (Ap4A) HIT family hydrolase